MKAILKGTKLTLSDIELKEQGETKRGAKWLYNDNKFDFEILKELGVMLKVIKSRPQDDDGKK